MIVPELFIAIAEYTPLSDLRSVSYVSKEIHDLFERVSLINMIDEYESVRMYDDVFNAACEKGYLHLIKYMIKHGTAPHDTDVWHASSNGHLDVLKYFHTIGVDLSVNISVVLASRDGHLDVLKYLHQNGADISDENDDAIYWAVGNGHLDVLKYLHKNGGDTLHGSYIRRASYYGYLDVVMYLHENGVAVSVDNDSPVYFASCNGHLDIVKYLHEHGADIFTRNNDSVCQAHKNGHHTIVDYLVKNGAKL